MREQKHYLTQLLSEGVFRFGHLKVGGIDNMPVYDVFGHAMADQEFCLLHRDVASGDDYLDILHDRLESAISKKKALPVVRFADGEYAYYDFDLHCNGLYQQAESAEAIREAMPRHIEALTFTAETGHLAPLVYPGNIGRYGTGQETGKFWSFLKKEKKEPSAGLFLDLLCRQGIELTRGTYIPFYIVYAYLTSGAFARIVHGRKICILNSDWNREACVRWFERRSSRPELSFVEIPGAYVATRWPAMKDDILRKIPADTDLCLVGAGVGALLVCSDAARALSVPAVDAGHVLNMMNDLVNKSNGQRLYTLWHDTA